MIKRTKTKAPGSSLRRHIRSCKKFLRREAGGLAVYAALVLPVFAGMAGVGMDVSVWYALKRDVQGMADAAAIAAAHSLLAGEMQSEAIALGVAEATRNGYDQGPMGNHINFSWTTSVNGNTTETVQATVRVRAPLYFASLFIDDVFVSAFSGGGTQVLGTQCILALHPTASGAVTVTGNITANVGCGVTSNSAAALDALAVLGSAELYATPVQAVGGIFIDGAAQVISDHPLMSGPSVDDPFDEFTMPADEPSGCDFTEESVDPADTITYTQLHSGGTKFCDGLVIKGDVTFEPGIYYIDGGQLEITSQATVSADGVTFVLTGPDPASVATTSIDGSGGVYIAAPNSGPTAGFAIVQDPLAEVNISSGHNVINGDSDFNILGAVYFRNQAVDFSGNSTIGPPSDPNSDPGCIQIVALTVELTGSSVLYNDPDACQTVGASQAGTGGGIQVVLTR